MRRKGFHRRLTSILSNRIILGKNILPNNLFLDSVHFLLLFEVFLHSTFDYLFDNLVFVVCRMTFVTSFNLDWSWYSCSNSECFTADAVNSYFIEVLWVNSLFHGVNNKVNKYPWRNVLLHLEISLIICGSVY